MISLNQISMRYGEKILFEKVSLRLDPQKRYGLTGANGAGKSTLLRIMSGEEKPEDGNITIPAEFVTGFLKQNQFEYENTRILDVVLMGKKKLWNAVSEKKALLAKDTHNPDEQKRLAEIEDILAEEYAYQSEAEAARLLSGLGISAERHEQNMSVLSGGFKLRVLLAQTLFTEPDFLLLDEPTNHLDIVSIAWLEKFLVNEFEGILVVVSHDRNFINRISTDILDVDYNTVTHYKGNYDKFLKARKLIEEQRQREIENTEKKIAETRAFIDRFKAKASKARQAQSRVKQLDRIEIPEIIRSSRQYPDFQFAMKTNPGKVALKAVNISKSYGENHVLSNVSFEINRSEKVAIIGPNGIGKSTLLKILAGKMQPDNGKTVWGYEAEPSYFAQDFHSEFTEKITVLDWLYQYAHAEPLNRVRGTLASVLFSQNDVNKPVTALSGGESARLLLARIILEKNNVLLLDEPTNHLDLESLEMLEKALNEYPGTVLMVSHDRHFVENTAERILALNHDSIIDYSGSYEQYLNEYNADFLGNVMVNKQAPSNGATTSNDRQPATLSYEERKTINRKISAQEKQIKKLEAAMAECEKTIHSIDNIFADPEVYQKQGAEGIAKMQQQKEENETAILDHIEQIDAIQKELSVIREQLA